MDSCGNQTWKVGVVNHAAFHLTQVDDKWIGVDGRDFEILKILSDRLNFRYELIPSVDKQWGSCNEEGICGGLVGMVVRKEIDIAISSMTSTAARAKYCDFSYPYFQDELTFVTKKPDMKIVNSMFFVKPFQIQLWIFVVGFLSLFILVTKTMQWLNLFETKLFELQNLTAIILKQDASIPTSMNESRSLIIVAFLLVLVGCTCKIYECTLTSATSLTTASQPLDKLEDMIEAIKNQDYVIGAIVGSAPYYRIMSSELEYLKIFANSTMKKGYQLHRSHKEGLIRALTQNFATVGAKLLLKKTALESGLDLSKFHFASDYLFMDQNSVVFGRDFRCKDVINKCLVVLAGAGLMTKWEMRSNWRMNNGRAKDKPNEKYIDFSDLKLVIIGLIFAYSFALAVLEVEMIFSCISKLYFAQRNKMSQ